VSDKTEQGLDALKQQLYLLPETLSRTILNRIRQHIHYEPVIGIMGKTGSGKSSLCNALFQQPLVRSAMSRAVPANRFASRSISAGAA
jgi:predicted GTPase